MEKDDFERLRKKYQGLNQQMEQFKTTEAEFLKAKPRRAFLPGQHVTLIRGEHSFPATVEQARPGGAVLLTEHGREVLFACELNAGWAIIKA